MNGTINIAKESVQSKDHTGIIFSFKEQYSIGIRQLTIFISWFLFLNNERSCCNDSVNSHVQISKLWTCICVKDNESGRDTDVCQM